MKTNKYQQQAIDFLTKTNTVMEIKFKKSGKYFDDDKEVRDIYKITLFKNDRKYTFNFGNSRNNSGILPNEYDILACLEKYNYENFEDFCSELGYDVHSRKAEKIYNACEEQYLQLTALYSEDEMNELREIQ